MEMANLRESTRQTKKELPVISPAGDALIIRSRADCARGISCAERLTFIVPDKRGSPPPPPRVPSREKPFVTHCPDTLVRPCGRLPRANGSTRGFHKRECAEESGRESERYPFILARFFHRSLSLKLLSSRSNAPDHARFK